MVKIRLPQKKIELRMTIEGELAKRLEAIKEYLQLETYTDTIRALITEKYERIRG
jgi:hypothetical protein